VFCHSAVFLAHVDPGAPKRSCVHRRRIHHPGQGAPTRVTQPMRGRFPCSPSFRQKLRSPVAYTALDACRRSSGSCQLF
jgi:hypothetical protein